MGVTNHYEPSNGKIMRIIKDRVGNVNMLERDIEKAFVKRVKSLGGMAEKFTSPNRRSVPDRLVTLPDGKIIFVELKRPGGKPTDAQRRDHERRRALGCDVRVIDSMALIKCFPGSLEQER
jgi:hypothetical protein